MADNSVKKATCPICGVQEEAGDATALQSEMEEHMRTAHNMSMSDTNASADIRKVRDENGILDDFGTAPDANLGPGVTGLTGLNGLNGRQNQ